MKAIIEVEITDINIEEYQYTFNYSVTVNGEHEHSGKYESEHAWQGNLDGFRAVLENGFPVTIS